MNNGGDALAVLAWGLRRYAWLVVLLVIGFAVAAPAAMNRGPDEYQARAQVGPSQALALSKLDALPRLGETVFNNGQVADSVRQALTPAVPRSEPVIPRRVDLVAAQDNIVFTIVARSEDPRTAQHVANIAAERFTAELNKYSQTVGSFAVQNLANRPATPVDRVSETMAVAVGGLAGLATGVGLIALWLVWRRPTVDVATAEEVTGAPVFGKVLLATQSEFTRGLPQLCRRVLSGPTDVLLLAGHRRTRRERRLLSAVLTEVLSWHRDVVSPTSEPGVNRSDRAEYLSLAGPHLIIVDEPSQIEIATRSENAITLLIAREGISGPALRRLAEQYLDGQAEGVVLVRRPHFAFFTRFLSTPPWTRQRVQHGSRFARGGQRQNRRRTAVKPDARNRNGSGSGGRELTSPVESTLVDPEKGVSADHANVHRPFAELADRD